jgi:hypothetical protein
MAVHVRYLRQDEYAIAAEFLHRYWSPNHVYTRDRRLFDWTFGRRGLAGPDEYTFAVAAEGREVVGILGGIPFAFNNHGDRDPGVWLTNWFVRPEARATGAGILLLSVFQKPRRSVLISFGITQNVAILYRQMNWSIIDNLPRFCFVLPGREARAASLFRSANPEWTWEDSAAIARWLTLEEEFAARDSFQCFLPGDWDERGWKRWAPVSVGGARDLPYLTWRYAEHPAFHYETAVVEENGEYGLAVWRVESVRQPAVDFTEGGERIGRIVEFLPLSLQNARQLFGIIVRSLREADAVGADFYVQHAAIAETVRQIGMRDTLAHVKGMAIPSRFQPVDNRGGRILSAVGGTMRGDQGQTLETADWYWTKSDSDQDRPN